ncbi:hypothetical protein ASG88_04510 [Nocardioides sp. Soil777]|uniref:hypothetical protein n=1 Tax=Nocardioides sp. Soil777 TaxID=1736409 RepID=UPI000703532E|nr:hypothetical protein [Nocardioides sp. Soil777]KRF02638.1 hypothetical protein ASG88_04510 [Nocardioides sp. Soil777]
MSTKPRLQPTRRTVLRTAAWTAPAVSIAVAAPAFAAMSNEPSCTTAGTRNGANFYATVGCNMSVTAVQIGDTPAVFDGIAWHAKLTGVGQIGSTQSVIVTTAQGTVTSSVTFIG